MKTALIIIDLQNDYFPGGSMELVGIEPAAKNAQQLLAHFRAQQRLIFHVQHLAIRPNATFFIPNTPGADIHATVTPQSGETVIIKHYPNSFRDTDLQEKLEQHQVEQLIICGAMSHMCIDSTTRAAFDLGYKCIVVADACATKDLSFDNNQVMAQQVQNAFMAGLNGLFAEVASLQHIYPSHLKVR